MQPIVSVTNLSKTYASGFHALKNINLSIRRGEIFALLGPNGAGKTTLINLLTGVLTPTAGQVWLQGRDVTHLTPSARVRMGLSRTFQINQLFPI